jgi:hypothetical protein
MKDQETREGEMIEVQWPIWFWAYVGMHGAQRQKAFRELLDKYEVELRGRNGEQFCQFLVREYARISICGGTKEFEDMALEYLPKRSTSERKSIPDNHPLSFEECKRMVQENGFDVNAPATDTASFFAKAVLLSRNEEELLTVLRKGFHLMSLEEQKEMVKAAFDDPAETMGMIRNLVHELPREAQEEILGTKR